MGNEMGREEPFNQMITFDYKEVVTDQHRLSFFVDSYKNFGWFVDENVSLHNKRAGGKAYHHTNLRLMLKRDRKIMNKMELTRLQRNFEFCLKEIDRLERMKTSEGTMWSIGVGVVATCFMALSVMAVTAEPAHWILGILAALPAFAGWIAPYYIYRKKVASKTKQVEGLIEEKEEEIYEICEKGYKLIANY